MTLSKKKNTCACYYNELIKKEKHESSSSVFIEKNEHFCNILIICLCYKDIIRNNKLSKPKKFPILMNTNSKK